MKNKKLTSSSDMISKSVWVILIGRWSEYGYNRVAIWMFRVFWVDGNDELVDEKRQTTPIGLTKSYTELV